MNLTPEQIMRQPVTLLTGRDFSSGGERLEEKVTVPACDVALTIAAMAGRLTVTERVQVTYVDGENFDALLGSSKRWVQDKLGPDADAIEGYILVFGERFTISNLSLKYDKQGLLILDDNVRSVRAGGIQDRVGDDEALLLPHFKGYDPSRATALKVYEMAPVIVTIKRRLKGIAKAA